jgi:hypothetical protein
MGVEISSSVRTRMRRLGEVGNGAVTVCRVGALVVDVGLVAEQHE